MNPIDLLHNQAMEKADHAFYALRDGNDTAALQFNKEALELEREAAMMLINQADVEPTRSILFKSAACLAFDVEDYKEASRLVHLGLSGNPPGEIARELKELLSEINAALASEVAEDKEEGRNFMLQILQMDLSLLFSRQVSDQQVNEVKELLSRYFDASAQSQT